VSERERQRQTETETGREREGERERERKRESERAEVRFHTPIALHPEPNSASWGFGLTLNYFFSICFMAPGLEMSDSHDRGP
jgi:hypothetical protein